MSKRVLIIGYVLMEYIGEKEIDYRGKVPVGSRKYTKVGKGDIVVADEVTAITYCRGTQWKRVESDVDISTLFASVEPLTMESLSEEAIKELKIFFSEKSLDGGISNKPKIITQSNLDKFTDEELIAFAKSKSVTGVTKRSSRDKVIPLILPFLQTE